METATKRQTLSGAAKKPKTIVVEEKPKKLSKLGQWMRDNPGGILEYVDWRAINR